MGNKVKKIYKKIRKKIKSFYKYLKYNLEYMKKYIKSKNFRNLCYYVKQHDKKTLLQNYIFYESFHGSLFGGNPYALFLYLYKNKDFQNFKHVIAIEDIKNPIIKPYLKDPKVIIVKSSSKKYIKYLESCKYIINNVSFKPAYVKKEGQIYIYTWHSTLLKSLGSHGNHVWESRTINRNMLNSDYFISPNKYTEKLLLEAYYLDDVYNKPICDLGYPRNDFIFNSDKQKLRTKLGVKGNEKIILYAPTWRGEIIAPKNMVDKFIEYYEEIKKNIDINYKVFLKLHNMVYKYIEEKHKKYLAPFDIDTNQLLAVSDILISDYSGIMFDYLNTNNPIILFTFDREEYEKEQGKFYIKLEDIPSTICNTVEEVVNAINNIDVIQLKLKKKYNEFKNKIAYSENGNSCKNVCDVIFKHKKSNNVYQQKLSKREKILIAPGYLIDEKKLQKFIQEINELNTKKYQITILFHYQYKNIENHLKIKKGIKLIYICGENGYTRKEYVILKRLDKKMFDKSRKLVLNASQRSMKRTINDLNFDYIIDYGMNAMNSFVLANGVQAKAKIICLRNDNLSKNKCVKNILNSYNIIYYEENLKKKIEKSKTIASSKSTKSINLKQIISQELGRGND